MIARFVIVGNKKGAPSGAPFIQILKGVLFEAIGAAVAQHLSQEVHRVGDLYINDAITFHNRLHFRVYKTAIRCKIQRLRTT